jgi:hypothetical protein
VARLEDPARERRLRSVESYHAENIATALDRQRGLSRAPSKNSAVIALERDRGFTDSTAGPFAEQRFGGATPGGFGYR